MNYNWQFAMLQLWTLKSVPYDGGLIKTHVVLSGAIYLLMGLLPDE